MKLMTLGTILVLAATACADELDHAADGGAGAQSTTTGVCMLHACASDTDCAGCDQGRTACFETRCTACSAASPSGCDGSFICASSGFCEPPACMTDAGVPVITCSTNSDCAGCDPAHQVCDLKNVACVACTFGDDNYCLTTEFCTFENRCALRCPSTCVFDSDCAMCRDRPKCEGICI